MGKRHAELRFNRRCEKLRHISRIPIIWCLAATLLLCSAYRTVRWSFVDASVNISAAADNRSWREVASDSLTKSVEYRPALDLGTKLAYQIIGLNLGTYKVIVGLEFALLLALLMVIFRPAGWRRGAAATVALAVAVGLHTSQILFLFVPLNAYSTSMLLVLGMIALSMTPRFRPYEWFVLPLTFLALVWLEVGILIAPLAVVAWLMNAPGTSWKSVAAASAGLAIYLSLRMGLGPGVGLTSPDTGLGFSNIGPAESAELFKHVPWLFWLHNVAATLLTVLFSEPRAGRFQFIEALLRGDVPLWMWIHVISSVVTTVVVAVSLIAMRSLPVHRGAKRDGGQRDWLIAALGGVLVVGGSALGFLYTRDRIGLPVGFGYAMIVYAALSGLLERPVPGWRAAAATALVVMLGLGWSIRAVEFYVALRETAWDYHLEWDRPEAVAAAAQSAIIARMRQSAVKRRPADAQRDPLWTYALFQRRFQPER